MEAISGLFAERAGSVIFEDTDEMEFVDYTMHYTPPCCLTQGSTRTMRIFGYDKLKERRKKEEKRFDRISFNLVRASVQSAPEYPECNHDVISISYNLIDKIFSFKE